MTDNTDASAFVLTGLVIFFYYPRNERTLELEKTGFKAWLQRRNRAGS